MRKKHVNIPPDVKVKFARLCIEKELTLKEAANILSVTIATVGDWVCRYRVNGEAALLPSEKPNNYSDELKRAAVQSYMNGEGSYSVVAARYGLRSHGQLRDWVMMYNNGEHFSDKKSGGSRMTTSRRTTKEERIHIAKDCLENGRNYGETAIKYNVSYQQVYSWVNHYENQGDSGLEDRRGIRKASQVPRTEVEDLQIELAKLRKELRNTRMERDLLKKVKELERKDLYRK